MENVLSAVAIVMGKGKNILVSLYTSLKNTAVANSLQEICNGAKICNSTNVVVALIVGFNQIWKYLQLKFEVRNIHIFGIQC